MKKMRPIKPIVITVEKTPVYEEKRLSVSTTEENGNEKTEHQEVGDAPDRLLGYHLRRKVVMGFRKDKKGIVMPKKKGGQ